jgi:hypothetical protein
MKWSSILLTTLGVAAISGILGSNYIMKKVYDNTDKSDPYWNFRKVFDQPFHHLKINGGNISNLVYEQSDKHSVKLLTAWKGASDGSVKTSLNNDTLTIDFPNEYKDLYEKFWLRDEVTVRISSPQLMSIQGIDTKLFINKFNQPTLNIYAAGNTKLLINTYRNKFDSINVIQRDSSLAYMTKSDEIIGPNILTFNKVNADCSGNSLLNLRSSVIDHLDLKISDSASVALSGATLEKFHNTIAR